MKKVKALTQKQRRVRIVLGYFGSVLLIFFQFGAPNFFPDVGITFALASWFLILGTIASLLRPLGYAKKAFSDPHPEFDERQQLMRYKAHRIAFYVTFTFIFVLMVAASIYGLFLENTLVGSADVMRVLRPIIGTFFLLLIAHYTMPLAMIAWLEPDPPTELDSNLLYAGRNVQLKEER